MGTGAGFGQEAPERRGRGARLAVAAACADGPLRADRPAGGPRGHGGITKKPRGGITIRRASPYHSNRLSYCIQGRKSNGPAAHRPGGQRMPGGPRSPHRRADSGWQTRRDFLRSSTAPDGHCLATSGLACAWSLHCPKIGHFHSNLHILHIHMSNNHTHAGWQAGTILAHINLFHGVEEHAQHGTGLALCTAHTR